MSEIKLPRLLDANRIETARLHPSRLTVTLCLTPLSTATMFLPEGEPAVTVRQWVELYGPDGSLGIYRVSSVGTVYGSEQNVRLEHGIAALDDVMIIPGKDTDGNDITEITGTMTQVLTAILAKQPVKVWELGTVDVPTTKTYKVTADRSSALEALLEAVKQASGYALTFDQTTAPWTVSLAKLPAGVGSECRLLRNMDDVTVSLDDGDLCTRGYAAALTGGYLDADTVSTWGVVGKALNMDDDADPAEALTYAQEYLAEHKNPTLTVEIDAVRLAEITGESLDSFALGRLCRAALPEYGVTMDERIVTMVYSDLVNAPEQVKLTLSHPGKDTSSRLAGIAKDVASNSRGGRRAGSAIKEQSKVIDLIRTDISETGDRMTAAEIRIDGAEAQIALKASKTTVDALGTRISQAEIDIDGAEAQIALKVSKDGVVSAINMSTEAISIDSAKINLNGYVTASQLSAEAARFDNLVSGSTKASAIWAAKVTAATLLVGGYECKWLYLKDGSGTSHWYLTRT